MYAAQSNRDPAALCGAIFLTRESRLQLLPRDDTLQDVVGSLVAKGEMALKEVLELVVFVDKSRTT